VCAQENCDFILLTLLLLIIIINLNANIDIFKNETNMIRFLDLAAGAVEAAELMAVHVKDCT
jgi:hypothetical protein